MCEKIGGLNNGIPSRWPSCLRSIPAHAGEPTGLTPDNQRLRVYPRPRGGTGGIRQAAGRVPGLSPPTRGNPNRTGSIRMLAGGGAYRSRMPGAVQLLGPAER